MSLANSPRDRLLRRSEAAEILGCKTQTLAKWAMTGRVLPVVHLPQTRAVRYRLSDVDALILSQQPAR
jgi:predicted site-specific integrase-resolvase